MLENSEELLKYIKDEGVEMVDVRFCDLPGIMQHFTVPVSSFDQSVFDDGLGFDGSSIRGFQAINESDMQLYPDPTSAYIDPFRSSKTLNVNFFIHDPITGEAYSRDPRNIARKALAYLASTGIGDTAYFAPEAEFTSSTASATPPMSTRASTTSTRSRAGGTPARRATTTSATRPASRVATSPSSPTTTTATCAPTWSRTSSPVASSWSGPTTRSAPRARRRSTTASTRCSRPPTT